MSSSQFACAITTTPNDANTGAAAFVATGSAQQGVTVSTGGALSGVDVAISAPAGAQDDTVSVSLVEQALADANLPVNILVDCSHANSYKRPEMQPLVMRDVVHQIRQGNRSIVGLMMESFIEGGNQAIPADLAQLRYGCSVTDACLDWPSTAALLGEARDMLREALAARHGAPRQGAEAA